MIQPGLHVIYMQHEQLRKFYAHMMSLCCVFQHIHPFSESDGCDGDLYSNSSFYKRNVVTESHLNEHSLNKNYFCIKRDTVA
jgi:hypothetical protein